MLGGEDLSAIFGEWAKVDAAEASAGAALPALPPALRSTAPSLPNEQQLEAIAPPALLRMASGEGPTGWVPPKLTRSLSSFFCDPPSRPPSRAPPRHRRRRSRGRRRGL